MGIRSFRLGIRSLRLGTTSFRLGTRLFRFDTRLLRLVMVNSPAMVPTATYSRNLEQHSTQTL